MATSTKGRICLLSSPVGAAQLMPEPQQGNRDTSIGIDQFTMSAPDGHFKLPRLQPSGLRRNTACG